jgi:hypothetical protein
MTTTTDTAKAHILAALDTFIHQRPGLEYGNYGDQRSYRAEVRSIGKDLQHARALLSAVEHSGITGEELAEAFRAYSGRLSWDGSRLEYCTGQYFPTEYRRAACAVLAQALWDHYREDYAATATGNESKGDAIRRNFRRRFGRAIAGRWMD